MAEFQPLSGLVGRLETSLDSAETTDPGEIDKDGFLELLITQMQNQDPLDPMDNTEYASSLAQFTMVEQMENLNGLTEQGIEIDYLLAQSINNTMASNLVGQEVVSVGNTIQVSEDTVSQIMYKADDFLDNVEISIVDESGNEVYSETFASVEEGEHIFQWDGLDERDEAVDSGTYYATITQVDNDGIESELVAYQIGYVDAVRYEDNGAVLVVDGITIQFGDVVELREGLTDEEDEEEEEDPTSNSLDATAKLAESLYKAIGLAI